MSEILPKEVLTADEVAEYLGLSRITVREKARKGEIPGRRVGRIWRFAASVIEELQAEPVLEDESANKPPHPWKRWCHNGHDTYECGRYRVSKSCVKCIEEKNKDKNEREKAARAQMNLAEYMPHLKAYREKRGYTRSEIAWESALPQAHSLTADTIAKIEEQKQKASYRQRVAIFQAFNVLGAREREQREAEMEQIRRRVRAGVA